MPTEPPKAEPPKRERRWFRFSLRSLLIFVAIAAVQSAVCLPMLSEWQKYNNSAERMRRWSELLRRSFRQRPDLRPDQLANRL
jgi:hypothetical protein